MPYRSSHELFLQVRILSYSLCILLCIPEALQRLLYQANVSTVSKKQAHLRNGPWQSAISVQMCRS